MICPPLIFKFNNQNVPLNEQKTPLKSSNDTSDFKIFRLCSIHRFTSSIEYPPSKPPHSNQKPYKVPKPPINFIDSERFPCKVRRRAFLSIVFAATSLTTTIAVGICHLLYTNEVKKKYVDH